MIVGTSGGAIVDAAIAMGRPMSDVREFVTQNANFMRKPAQWRSRWRSLYDKGAVANHLQELYGVETTLGSDIARSEELQ